MVVNLGCASDMGYKPASSSTLQGGGQAIDRLQKMAKKEDILCSSQEVTRMLYFWQDQQVFPVIV